MDLSKYTEKIAVTIKAYQGLDNIDNSSNVNLSFIDELIPKDSLVFLGGRPRTGKTSLILDFVAKNTLNILPNSNNLHVVSPKKALLYFIDHKEDLVLRRWCSIATQSLIEINESENFRSYILNEYSKAIDGAVIDINFVSDIKNLLSTLESDINKVDPEIIVIDGYNFPLEKRDNSHEPEHLLDIIKIQKNTNKMFLIASCLGHDAYQRGGDKRHYIEDFHSVKIESEADVVMLLHRPELSGFDCDEEGYSLKGAVEIDVAINRCGNEGETINWHAIHEVPKMGKLLATPS